ncbi:hypothetical protein D3C87_1422270 [compost metagenome]
MATDPQGGQDPGGPVLPGDRPHPLQRLLVALLPGRHRAEQARVGAIPAIAKRGVEQTQVLVLHAELSHGIGFFRLTLGSQGTRPKTQRPRAEVLGARAKKIEHQHRAPGEAGFGQGGPQREHGVVEMRRKADRRHGSSIRQFALVGPPPAVPNGSRGPKSPWGETDGGRDATIQA